MRTDWFDGKPEEFFFSRATAQIIVFAGGSDIQFSRLVAYST